MSCPHAYLKRPQLVIATFATLFFLFAPRAWAAPHSSHVRRETNSSGSKIVAPIIAALVFIVAIPMVFYRKSLLSKLPRITFPSMPRLARQRPSPTTVRNLTAEEIAGTAATNESQAAAATRTNRRTGRTRRTPSQISTRSLPAYMKEPGELELVIIQGSQDMEDAPLTAQVVMPPVREDDDESANSHSRGASQASYVIINDDPLAQTPLLERNASNESNVSTHQRENSHVSAGSVDISDFRHNNPSSPLPNNPEMPDPRGEAPPYFEVVGAPWDVRATSGDLARVDTADTLPIAPDILPVSSAPVRRRSMFRGLIDAASRALSSPHTSPQSLPLSRTSRDAAVSPSPRPSNLSNVGTGSSLVGHRPTPSSSGSVQSVTSSAFGRTASRTRSRSVTNVAAGLTSPSVLSITSISSPLTHTAVRTDFVYPRSGPTPEQLKLISSVESVSKFGVPYGPDAVAFASASLVNLHGPPPEFEERPSIEGLPGPSETRARASSALSRVSRDGNTPDSRISLSSIPSSLRESTVASETATHDPEVASPHPDSETRTPAPDLNVDASLTGPGPSEDTKEQELVTPIGTVPPRIPSPSPTVGTTSTAVTVTKATAAELGVVPESSISPAISSGHRPALPSVIPEMAEMAPATGTTRNHIVPSSFRMPSTSQGRTQPASRSSSMETFRTAASKPGQSDTEHETDTFTDAESGAENVETPPATPHAVRVESTVLSHVPPAALTV